jgi:hypothetical protein
MTLSTHLTRRLKKGLRKSPTIAFAACAIAFPAQALAGGPESEKTAGLWPSAEPSAPIVSEKLAGLQQAAQPSAPIVSEKLAGLWSQVPASEPVVSTSGHGFDWSDAGIGAAITFAVMLGAAAAALTIRRRRGSLAY